MFRSITITSMLKKLKKLKEAIMDIKTGFLRAAVAAALLLPLGVNAASISFYLDQTNIDPASGSSLIDGTNFLMVTVDDQGLAPGDINFTVQTLSPLNSMATSNFGIQGFSLNTLLDTTLYDQATNITGLPAGWSTNVTPPPNQYDGFGTFDISVSDGGSARTDLLTFSVTGINGDSIMSYLEASLQKNGTLPPQGSVYFSAHVAGFDDGYYNTSAYFGGLTAVPLPPAALLLASALGGLVSFRRLSS